MEYVFQLDQFWTQIGWAISIQPNPIQYRFERSKSFFGGLEQNKAVQGRPYPYP